jgi:hypothetical protein
MDLNETFSELFKRYNESEEEFFNHLKDRLPKVMATLGFIDLNFEDVEIPGLVCRKRVCFRSDELGDDRIKGVKLNFLGLSHYSPRPIDPYSVLECQATLIFHDDRFSKAQPTIQWKSFLEIKLGLLPWIHQVVIPTSLNSGSWHWDDFTEFLLQTMKDGPGDDLTVAVDTTKYILRMLTPDEEEKHILH